MIQLCTICLDNSASLSQCSLDIFVNVLNKSRVGTNHSGGSPQQVRDVGGADLGDLGALLSEIL